MMDNFIGSRRIIFTAQNYTFFPTYANIFDILGEKGVILRDKIQQNACFSNKFTLFEKVVPLLFPLMFAKFSTFAQFIQPIKITPNYGYQTNWFATFWPTNHNTCSTHLFTNEIWKNCISVCTHPRATNIGYYHRKLHASQLLWILQTSSANHPRQQLIALQSTHQAPISNCQTNLAHRRNTQRIQINTYIIKTIIVN